MKWVVALVAVVFAALALSMVAPVILHDPFGTAAVFLVGVFVGMLLENARRCT